MRHSRRAFAAVAVLATLMLAWPALGGAFLAGPNSDQYIAGYAFREFAAQSLRAGHGFPLWNPFQFAGMPYVAAMHGDIFYPTFLLRLLLPTDIAMTWGFVLHVMLAGYLTMCFLSACGVSWSASAIGGVAYLLSGAVASYASPGHDGKLFVSALLPGVLWALVRAIRDGRRGAWGTLALLVGMATLSPHPQLLQYLLLTAGSFAAYLALRPRNIVGDVASESGSNAHGASSVDRAAPANVTEYAYRKLLVALAAVTLGLVIGAVQYLPVREYVAWSPRAGGRGYEYATSFSMPLEETINLYLPQFSGLLQQYWGRNGIHFHSEYAGVSVLLLMFGAFGGGVLNRHRKHAWFWLGVAIVGLFWAWGGNTPFYQLVYALVPGAKYFRAPSTMLFVVAFACATLAAFGAERALANRLSTRYLLAWVGSAALLAVLASFGFFTALASSLAPLQLERIDANGPAVTLGAWRAALFVAALATVLIALGRERLSASRATWIVLGLVALDLWSVERNYWNFAPRANIAYAGDAIIDFLKRQPEPARVIALPLSENMAPHDPFIAGDALMIHGVRGVLGYHGNELGRYQELYGKNDGLQSIANPNFWSLTNARFLYTNANAVPIPGTRLVAGPVRNAAGTMSYLYQLPGEHPAAWVVPLLVTLDDATSKAALLNPNFDVRRVALVPPGSSAKAVDTAAALPEPLSVTARTTYGDAGAINVSLEGAVPSGSALIVSENFYPGWQATVDGRPAKVTRADYSLIGVELPANAHQISLRFSSRAYAWGRLITWCAVALAFVWMCGGVLADRRRIAPQPL